MCLNSKSKADTTTSSTTSATDSRVAADAGAVAASGGATVTVTNANSTEVLKDVLNFVSGVATGVKDFSSEQIAQAQTGAASQFDFSKLTIPAAILAGGLVLYKVVK